MTRDPNRDVLVACDLDNTLIYGRRWLPICDSQRREAGLVAVEQRSGQTTAFMSARAAWTWIAMTAAATTVPATTRSTSQYARLRLPGPPPTYAVVANGGHLLQDGSPDAAWHRKVRRRVAAASAQPGEILGRLGDRQGCPWILDVSLVDDLFFRAQVDRLESTDSSEELKSWCAGRGWILHTHRHKLLCVPEPLDKAAAVREVAQRVGSTRILAAGDSAVDRSMLEAADFGIRPAHGELFEQELGCAPSVRVTTRSGIAGGEELVLALQRECLPRSGAGRANGTVAK